MSGRRSSHRDLWTFGPAATGGCSRRRRCGIRMPVATLRILARDFESDAFLRDGSDFMSPLRLQFSDFFVESIAQGSHRSFEYARKFFDEAMYGDCLIERAYETIPQMSKDFSGFGAITLAPEEVLLLLRLF